LLKRSSGQPNAGRLVKRLCKYPDFVPPIRHIRPAEIVVIPTSTIEALEATVLNSFLLRQTDPIPGFTAPKPTTPFNFNQ
jgi:hypothetical protein